MPSFDPTEMDQETLDNLASESWFESILLRGVLVFGVCTLIACCLTTIIIAGTITDEDMHVNIAVSLVVGCFVGGCFRFAVMQEVKRREHSE